MGRPATGNGAARPATKAMVIAILCGSAACNAISGVDEIDFTPAPGTGGTGTGGTTGGTGTGGTGTGGTGTGGTGEVPYDITCGSGNVAVGIHGRSGSWLNSIGLICAPLSTDGSLGATFKTVLVGGDGGAPGEVTCPAGQVMVGSERWEDASVVYKLDLRCQTVEQWESTGTVATIVPGLGAADGAQQASLCSQGYVYYQITGQAGQYISTINQWCKKI